MLPTYSIFYLLQEHLCFVCHDEIMSLAVTLGLAANGVNFVVHKGKHRSAWATLQMTEAGLKRCTWIGVNTVLAHAKVAAAAYKKAKLQALAVADAVASALSWAVPYKGHGVSLSKASVFGILILVADRHPPLPYFDLNGMYS